MEINKTKTGLSWRPGVWTLVMAMALSPSLWGQSKGKGKEEDSKSPRPPMSRPAPSKPAPSKPAPSRPYPPSRPAPSKPMERPKIPESKPAPSKPFPPSKPVERPSKPVERPSKPVDRPKVPESRPAPSKPVDRPKIPESKPAPSKPAPSRPYPPSRPVERPKAPVNKPSMPSKHAPDSDAELERNSWMRQRWDSGRDRMRHVRDDRSCRERVVHYQDDFRRVYLDRIRVRHDVYVQHHHDCHDWYRSYRRHGFYGGFYFGYRPVVDVTIYFWNPLWSWFYLDRVDDAHYQVWYGSHVHYRPISVFRHRRVYHPTVEFRNLVIGISDLDYETQGRFREGMENLTSQLGQKVANLTQSTVALDQDDVVVNNYQVLEDRAVVVEGYVWKLGTKFAFKGFINLRDPSDVMLFVPGNPYGEPTWDEIDLLQQMNDRILDLGGTVERE